MSEKFKRTLLCRLGLHCWVYGQRFFCDYNGWMRMPTRCKQCGKTKGETAKKKEEKTNE